MSNDIATIFATDPLKLTREDIDDVIKYYREKRAQFVLEGKAPKKVKSEKKSAGPDISLDDIVI